MPPITEAQLYEAFGLDPSQGQGEQVQEPAEPAAEGATVESAEGAQEQVVAEPAAEPTQPEEVPSEPAESVAAKGNQQEPTGKPQLSEEERRANAARRRQQEQQAAIDAAVRQERERNTQMVNDMLAKAGLKNTFTGEAITNMDQFQAWNQQFADNKLQQELRSGKMTVEGLQQVVSQHPVVQQAQQLIDQQKQIQQTQQAAADKARIDAELAEIAKMDPTIQGVADLLNMPSAAEFRGYVDKGYSFLDAFKLSNMERISAEKAEAAKQEALNNARGKDHLRASGNARGSGAASVPPTQMSLFRQMMPGKSDAEIQKYYNQYLSRKGG